MFKIRKLYLNINQKSLDNLCSSLQIDSSDREYYKFQRLITVVNQAYLKIALKEYIDTLSEQLGITKNIVFYFSIPPFLYEVVAAHLVKYGLNKEN